MVSTRTVLVFCFLNFVLAAALFVQIFSFDSLRMPLANVDKIASIHIYKGFGDENLEIAYDAVLDFKKKAARALNDDAVKAFIVNVWSSGGDLGIFSDMYDFLMYIRNKKPVVVFTMNAKSGGFVTALAGSRVVVSDNAFLGQLGSIMVIKNPSEPTLNILVVPSGPFKSLGYRPITPEEEALLKISVEHSLDFLKNAVIKARGERLKPGILEEIDDARFISAETAKEFGLIDEVGTYAVAVEEALRLTGLSREGTTIVEYENGAERIAPENIYLH